MYCLQCDRGARYRLDLKCTVDECEAFAILRALMHAKDKERVAVITDLRSAIEKFCRPTRRTISEVYYEVQQQLERRENQGHKTVLMWTTGNVFPMPWLVIGMKGFKPHYLTYFDDVEQAHFGEWHARAGVHWNEQREGFYIRNLLIVELPSQREERKKAD